MFASVAKFALLFLVAFSTLVSAQRAVTCGRNRYSARNVQDAITRGRGLVGRPIGRNNYPHTFRNRPDNLRMRCSGTMNEFPILRGGRLYNGGAPGADRVVFNNNGDYCGVMTHTGARNRSLFVLCRGS